MTSGPDFNSTSRRGFLALCAAIPLALSACSGGKQGPAKAQASNTGFPRTIKHRFGSTEVASPPSKVVALGTVEAETLVALGLAPLSRPGADSTSWYRAGLRALAPEDAPQNYDDSRVLSAGDFKDLKPDAFISVGSRLSREEYESLSTVAPVIVAPDSVPAAQWEPVTAFMAEVLGLKEPAAELISDARQKISDAAATYPGLKHSTALFVSASSASGSDLVLSGKSSAPLAFFSTVGLTPAQVVSALEKDVKPTSSRFPLGTGYLPRARADELAADVLVVSVPMSDYTVYKANKKLSSDFPAFGKGTVYVVAGDETVALQRQSILGALWAARNVLPELAKSAYKSKHA
ncbi:ABC transporter substrate-binding protein [Arthrobacter sp. Y-9]|uniref:ABC transporter substrate-binding protein n=1 Tax=Arthrobacter sp. Y-9 TaxID=3039385 RepID=UPI00241C95AA|nr:ABC transporter substrate-binding protein [Arthrobacter sp. Y-9]WFR83095.1 ABC transporter substrate-binding protein [Arthrobacter sp. Y-9]